MNTENLWGDLPKSGDLRTPVSILREQATILGDQTNNVLVGDVITTQRGGNIVSEFEIVAPALDNYRVTVLTISHDMTLYPLLVIRHLGGSNVQCPDETSFIAVLKETLSGKRVHQIVNSLLSQSKAA
ncbi:MAG: hypothetical protein DMF72_08860 [Acidobacteria bacterium]|nr:MAG: hypothetical protein DMF72_08860 [Acidobacteriota bacterium]